MLCHTDWIRQPGLRDEGDTGGSQFQKYVAVWQRVIAFQSSEVLNCVVALSGSNLLVVRSLVVPSSLLACDNIELSNNSLHVRTWLGMPRVWQCIMVG